MNAADLQAFVKRADDFLNPFVVKEARQAVRSRAVAWGLHAVLIVLAVILTLGMSGLSDNGGRGHGVETFVACQALLVLVCVYCIPLYVGVRMACETTSQTGMDLLRGLMVSPARMALGKWYSGMLVGLLAMSAFAPFLTMCYFLRGVSMVMVAAALWVGMLQLAVATQVAVLIGSLGSRWILKVIGTVIYLVVSLCPASISSGIVHIGMSGSAVALPIAVCVTTAVAVAAWLAAYGCSVASMNWAMLGAGRHRMSGNWDSPVRAAPSH